MREFESRIPSREPLSRKGTFALVKQAPEFADSFRELSEFMLLPHTDAQIAEMRDRFAGALFEIAARLHIQQTEVPLHHELLTPKQVAEFYYQLYRGEIRKHPFDSHGLMGRPLPDGITFPRRGPRLAKEVYEFTLVQHPDRLAGRLENKRAAMNNDKEKFPEIFGASKYVLVTPTMVHPSPVPWRDDWVRHEQLPFTHQEFGGLVNGIFNHYNLASDSGAASLWDLQVRARLQTRRAFGAFTSGEPLTWPQQGLIQHVIDEQNFPIEMFLN